MSQPTTVAEEFYPSTRKKHIALSSEDIYATVRQLRANGVDFMVTPWNLLRQRSTPALPVMVS